MTVSCYETEKRIDSYFYTYDSALRQYNFFVCTASSEGAITAKKIKVAKAVLGSKNGKSLDWASNGVYLFRGIDVSADVEIPLASIKGKAMRISSYILTIPLSLLLETG